MSWNILTGYLPNARLGTLGVQLGQTKTFDLAAMLDQESAFAVQLSDGVMWVDGAGHSFLLPFVHYPPEGAISLTISGSTGTYHLERFGDNARVLSVAAGRVLEDVGTPLPHEEVLAEHCFSDDTSFVDFFYAKYLGNQINQLSKDLLWLEMTAIKPKALGKARGVWTRWRGRA